MEASFRKQGKKGAVLEVGGHGTGDDFNVDKQIGSLSKEEAQKMSQGIEHWEENLEKEYASFKQEKDHIKINGFYKKINKLAHFVPFVRNVQTKMGLKTDDKFKNVMHQLKTIIEETEMDTHGSIAAEDVVALENMQYMEDINVDENMQVLQDIQFWNHKPTFRYFSRNI